MVTASLVKDLREKTGAGMMDCKKALVETKGDFEEAVLWLRKKGLSAAAKKADRIAAEGLTGVKIENNTGAIVELNSETDFVARNEQFQNLVSAITHLALNCNDLESLQAAIMPSGKTVADEIVENIGNIGENLSLRRMSTLKVKEGVVVSYVHNSVSDGLGKISVLVALESAGNKEELKALGKQIAMHIAATNPQGLNKEDIDPQKIQSEREIFFEQSRASGKPDNIIEKMVEGRIRKFLEEIVLLEQTFVIDGKTKVSEVIESLAKKIGNPITLSHFIRYEVGEGIQQQEKNFADEVAAVIKR